MPRIIAGSLGGRTVPGSVGKGTRPTSDRVREAIFSRLNTWDAIDGARVLDLFAGTGALGLEALSRGASHALFSEAHAASARQLQRSVCELGLTGCAEVRTARAEQVAQSLSDTAAEPRESGRYSLVFLDPPYEYPTPALEALLTALDPALTDDAVVVIERSSRTTPISWPAGFADDGIKGYGETVVQYGGPDRGGVDTENDRKDPEENDGENLEEN